MPAAFERRIANSLKVWNGTGPLSVRVHSFAIGLGGDKAQKGVRRIFCREKCV